MKYKGFTIAENYILSYPETNLSIQKVSYYGYPKDHIKAMTDLVSSDFDWQNSKIGIVNDFGLQVVKYLHFEKEVSFKNISILLLNTKKDFLLEIAKDLNEEFSWTGLNFDYIDLDNKNMSKEKFDLIIANPPFSRAVTNPFFKNIKNICNEATVLYLTSFSGSLGQGDPQSRESLNNFLSDIQHYGYFSKTVRFDVSVYHLKATDKSQETVFSDYCNSLRDPIELQIRRKLEKLPKLDENWFIRNLYTRSKEDKYTDTVTWMKWRMEKTLSTFPAFRESERKVWYYHRHKHMLAVS